MHLDIRFPIGLMFTVIGALLVLFGLAGDHSIYARSLGINVNLVWGSALLLFGIVLLGVSTRAGKRSARVTNR